MKRNPFRKRPLLDLLERFDRFANPDGDQKYYLIFIAIFLAVMIWLVHPVLNDEPNINRHIKYNEHTGQYYRDITY
ncbi:MAG: hypothetical protein J6W13_01585 [Salinivirgaceae bacterium]|nr:hypothetical protein [Salinivirgaceae bacterium]